MSQSLVVPVVGGVAAAIGCWLMLALFLTVLRFVGANLGSPIGWPIPCAAIIGVLIGLALWVLGMALEGIG